MHIEDSIRKIYFRTTDVAEIMGETYDTICYWDKFFGVCQIFKGEGNHRRRRFTRKDIAKFHIIKQLYKEEKYTLEGVKLQLQKLKL